MSEQQPDRREMGTKIRATQIITAVFGIVLAISGFNHGFFEALQGNAPTSGRIIQAIGEANRMWIHGSEEAFTIIPNFLVTGILAMMASIFIIIWSIFFIQKKYGTIIFLSLFIILFSVGGGIAQIVFFLPTWAYATRINKPLTWWSKILSKRFRVSIAAIWKYTLLITAVLFFIALEIAIFGFFPGIKNSENLLYLSWSCLAISFIMLHVTYISGFAYDIERLKSGLTK
jgi:hypothetical protein